MHGLAGFHDYNCPQMNAYGGVLDSGTLPEESSFLLRASASLFPAVYPHLPDRAPRRCWMASYTLAGISEGAGRPYGRRARREGSLPEAPCL